MSEESGRFGVLMELVGIASSMPADERLAWLEERCNGDRALLDDALELLEHADSGESLQGMTSALDAAVATTAARLRPTAPIPDRIGPFRILQVLGEGGMGVVYGASQEEPLQRDVAIKVVRGGLHSPRLIARFEAERRTLAALDHPSIARVFEAGSTSEGLPCFAMEWVHGLPITRYCTTHSLALQERLALFEQVLGAVQYAHQRAIVHRDLKPSNVLVTDVRGTPVVKVIDFGIARVISDDIGLSTAHTAYGARLGTLEYMSPEQAFASGDGVDTRSDVYALGVLLYELITGRLPIAAESLRNATPAELERLLRYSDPPTPSNAISGYDPLAGDAAASALDRSAGAARRSHGNSFPRELDWVVMHALEKDPGRRYQSAREFALDLERVRRHEPVSAAPPSFTYRARKFLRRRRGPVIAAAAMVLALLGGSVMAAVGLVRARNAQAVAEREAARTAGVSAFLSDMLGSVRPERARGEEMTVRRVLDWAATRLDEDSTVVTDPHVAAAVRKTIAESYIALGEYEKALLVLEPAVETLRASDAPDDELLASTVNWMAWLYVNLGDLHKAVGFAEEAVSAHERSVGRLSTGYTGALGSLANVHRGLGNLAVAESLLLVARDIDRQIPTGDLAFTLNSLGNVQSDLGRFEEAASTHRESLALRVSYIDENSPYLVASLTSLAVALTGQGLLAEALDTLQRALELGEPAYGADHPRVAFARAASVEPLLRLGRVEEAEEAALRALPVVESTFGPESWRAGDMYISIGNVSRARGDTARAIEHLTRAWNIISQSLGEEHPRARSAASELATLYASHGMPEPAASWSARAGDSPGSQQ